MLPRAGARERCERGRRQQSTPPAAAGCRGERSAGAGGTSLAPGPLPKPGARQAGRVLIPSEGLRQPLCDLRGCSGWRAAVPAGWGLPCGTGLPLRGPVEGRGSPVGQGFPCGVLYRAGAPLCDRASPTESYRGQGLPYGAGASPVGSPWGSGAPRSGGSPAGHCCCYRGARSPHPGQGDARAPPAAASLPRPGPLTCDGA